MNSELRTRLKNQASALLERTALKLELAPIGIALDLDFIEHVALFVAAVDDALAQDERADTVPPAEACGLCGHPRSACGCQPGADDPDVSDTWPTEPIPVDEPWPTTVEIEGRVRE